MQKVSWALQNSSAEKGKLFEFNTTLTTTTTYLGQYDWWGVYELTGEKKIEDSYSCNFKIYKPDENQTEWQERVIRSLKEKFPRVGIDIRKEEKKPTAYEPGDYVDFSVYNITINKLCDFFIEQGDVPEEEILKYAQWKEDSIAKYKKRYN